MDYAKDTAQTTTMLLLLLALALAGGLRVVVAGVGATETEVSMEAAFQGRCNWLGLIDCPIRVLC